MVSRTTLLIADAFYPDELPPESKTNTYLATALVKRGWNVSVWSHVGASVPVSFNKLKFVHGTNFWGLGEVLRLATWLAFNRPKQIIIMYHSELYSCRYEINWIPVIAYLLRLHCVTLFTSGIAPRRNRFQDIMLSILGFSNLAQSPVGPLGLSSKMIFYSESNRHQLLECDLDLISRSEIASPPNTLPIDAVSGRRVGRAALGLTDEAFLVGYFGLLYRSKGVEWLLEAIAILKSRGFKAKLVLIGPHGGVTSNNQWNADCQDYEALLKNMAKVLDIEDMVIWVGFCEDLKVAEYLLSCDMACLPFEHGLTNQRSSFIACAQIGLPLITTKTSSTDSFLLSQNSGIFYVSPRNATEIADGIMSLFRDEENRYHRATMLRNFAKKHFSTEAFVDCFDASEKRLTDINTRSL